MMQNKQLKSKIVVIALALAILGVGAFWYFRSHTPMNSSTVTESTNPLNGKFIALDPDNDAAKALAAERSTERSAQLRRIADQPIGLWFGDWDTDIPGRIERIYRGISAPDTVPMIVAYNVPNRDCGLYSAGGSKDLATYQTWIDTLSGAIGDRAAVVILEPDGLANLECLKPPQQQTRYQALSYAVTSLRRAPNVTLYIDAGNARWGTPERMTAQLKQVGIDQADGFSVNVSNYFTNQQSYEYGLKISNQLGGKHFVIDTSRNGRGALGEKDWCNPPGRGLGVAPTTTTYKPRLDAYLWIKRPGTSDGTCNGGPAAGQWWLRNALELSDNAKLSE